jgi:hypothetical protein
VLCSKSGTTIEFRSFAGEPAYVTTVSFMTEVLVGGGVVVFIVVIVVLVVVTLVVVVGEVVVT